MEDTESVMSNNITDSCSWIDCSFENGVRIAELTQFIFHEDLLWKKKRRSKIWNAACPLEFWEVAL